MPRSRRVALVLDCGHLAQPQGRVDGTPPPVGSYTWCPACDTFHQVVDVGRHLHAVPTDPGSDVSTAAPAAGRSPAAAPRHLRLVHSPQGRAACR